MHYACHSQSTGCVWQNTKVPNLAPVLYEVEVAALQSISFIQKALLSALEQAHKFRSEHPCVALASLSYKLARQQTAHRYDMYLGGPSTSAWQKLAPAACCEDLITPSSLAKRCPVCSCPGSTAQLYEHMPAAPTRS